MKNRKELPEEEKRVGNLLQTAEHYRIDRKIIRATVARHIDFPREEVGGTKHGWWFSYDNIDKWLLKNEWYRGTRSQSIRKLQQAVNTGEDGADLPMSAAKIRKELLQQDGKNAWQTRLLELEFKKKSGILVEREEIIGSMSVVMARLAKQLEMMPNLIGKKTGANDDQIKLWREHMDQARLSFVNDCESIFSSEEVVV